MGFKNMVERDNAAIILNTDEFAEYHTIKFDGKAYEHIPVVLTKVRQSERTILQSDHMQGVYLVTAKAYFNAKDTGENIPEKGKRFEIDDGEALGKPFFRRYLVATSENAMGMICVELEAFDE